MVREGRVFISPPPGDPQYGVGYYVTAYEVGAQVASASSGTTATVRAGHGFAANDKFIVGTDTTQYGRVTAVTTTTLTIDSAIPLAEGDLLVNLAADTGTTAPNFDGAGLTIYTDMAYANVAVNNTVLTDEYGRYRYYHKGALRWELVRTGTTPVAIYTEVATGSASIISNDGFGAFLHAQRQHATFPATFSSSQNWGHGLSFNKPSTASGSNATHFYRDGLLTWAIGEDFLEGERSYFGILSTKCYAGAGSWASGDMVTISWGGAETSLAGNVPRVAGQPGVDGPKFYFNGTFVPSNVQTYSGPFTYTFNTPTLQTSGDGMRSAIFQSALYGTGTFVNFDSGGVQINVTGGRTALTLINQTLAANKRTALIAAGKGGSTGFIFGTDYGQTDAQTWCLYDVVAGAHRIWVDANGGIGFGTTAGTQTYTFSKAQNSQTGLQVENNSTGTAGRSDVIAAASATQFVNLVAFSTGYTADATLAGDSGVFASGTGNMLHFGTGGAKRMSLHATSAKLGIGVDPPVEALQVVGALALNGDAVSGVASYTTFTGTSDVTANSSGVGTILFKGTTSRNSTGFVKVYIGTTPYYIPVFSAITG